jgi:8-oxo-dGTP diphosphatase
MTERRPAVGVGVVVLRAAAGADSGPEVLLIRRATPPRLGEWSLPGGRQHWGETLRDAARREVREETGLEIEILGLLDAVDALIPADNGAPGAFAYHYTLIDFAARAVGGVLQAGDDAAEAAWLPPEEAVRRVAWDETARIITEALRAYARQYD